MAYDFVHSGIERARATGTPWENKLSLQSFYYRARVEPKDFFRRITAPMLYPAAQEHVGEGPVELHRAVAASGGPNVEFHVPPYFNLDTYHEKRSKPPSLCNSNSPTVCSPDPPIESATG